ncbi:MAG: DNA replication protein DnaC [candidate division WS2 bacterium]|nr:DNA replication protein DnaC [Candidatus Psychracetigena formicireducens]
MSNLSNTLKSENFDYFDFSLFSTQAVSGESLSPKANIENIYKECLAFVDNFNKPTTSSLLFYGNPGSGKTFMCNCIAKDLLDRGKIVIYQTSFKILEILGDYKLRNSNSATLEASYKLLFDSDLLIIDDLGTELTNTFTNTELFNIINTRLINNNKMIISTNLSPNEIPDIYSSRLSSRVFGAFTFMKFYGKDLRWDK